MGFTVKGGSEKGVSRRCLARNFGRVRPLRRAPYFTYPKDPRHTKKTTRSKFTTSSQFTIAL